MGKVLYYAARQTGRAERICSLAKRAGVEFSKILPVEGGQQIGYLAGEKGFSKTQMSVLQLPPPLPEEMMIFCGLEEAQLDRALGMLRKNGLSVSLKAVMTPHNMRWTLAELYRELCAERAQFEKGI